MVSAAVVVAAPVFADALCATEVLMPPGLKLKSINKALKKCLGINAETL